ncbi:hypothetical protein DB347_17960 [Opitutaceae bacterium EW11]|nr:hypothetical protein DB347_17960 [Opitutaceae bacterium EW11]
MRPKRLEDFATEAELQEERAVPLWCRWFEEYLGRFNGNQDVSEQIRLKQGIAQKVFDEMFPLWRLLIRKSVEWQNHQLKYVIGNQPFDAVLSSDAGSEYLEVSVADWDHDEALRMKYFSEHGHVSAIGRVSYSGTARTGHAIEVENAAETTTVLIADKLRRVKERILAKAQKSYPPGTTLVVAFDDHIVRHDPNFAARFESILREARHELPNTFRRVYAMGMSGETLIEVR